MHDIINVPDLGQNEKKKKKQLVGLAAGEEKLISRRITCSIQYDGWGGLKRTLTLVMSPNRRNKTQNRIRPPSSSKQLTTCTCIRVRPGLISVTTCTRTYLANQTI